MNASSYTLTEVLGQPAVHLVSPDGAQATVLLHGAHVVSWVPAGGTEKLYLSPQAVAGEGQAVRGGVPVIFPRFAERGPDTGVPRHGFARTRAWEVEGHHRGKDHTQVTLVLRDSDATRALWPHRFNLELTVSVGADRLDLELFAENTDDHPWAFAAALHSYFKVSELANVRLQGLQGCRFEDNLLGGETVEDHPEKRFSGEMDRVYTRVPDLLLSDGPHRLALRSHNWTDAVVWNPGPDNSAKLSDMPDDDWQHMLCVEAARVTEPVTLQPGETWAGLHTLVVEAD